jgi:hypothetical protein
MKKKKENKKEEKKQEQIDNSSSEITGEHVDASNPVYNNCIFYQIDQAIVPQPGMNQQIMMPNNKMTEEMVEIMNKKLIDYISSMTGFSPEMVERVLDHAEEFMRKMGNRHDSDSN